MKIIIFLFFFYNSIAQVTSINAISRKGFFIDENKKSVEFFISIPIRITLKEKEIHIVDFDKRTIYYILEKSYPIDLPYGISGKSIYFIMERDSLKNLGGYTIFEDKKGNIMYWLLIMDSDNKEGLIYELEDIKEN